MHIDWSTLALQTINVLILVWLLSRYLYRPVMDAIAARQAAADKLIADARAENEKAAAEAAEVMAESDSFAAEAGQRQAEMRAEIDKERARLLQEAKAEAASVARQTEAIAAAERTRLNAALEDKAAILAGRMAETLLGRLPSPSMTDAMFAALLDRLRALPGEERRKLAGDRPLRAVTAAPVDAVARARYAQALGEALGASPDLEFSVDPALIAGFDLHGQHVSVSNSWRADLDAMLAKLREGERDGRA